MTTDGDRQDIAPSSIRPIDVPLRRGRQGSTTRHRQHIPVCFRVQHP